MRLTRHNITNLAGRTAVVTGENHWLALELVRQLVQRDARVVWAGPHVERMVKQATDVLHAFPRAQLSCEPVDLADVRSVHAFAEGVLQACDAVHLLVNNAGVVSSAARGAFEGQVGTNHLGHFALTQLLLERLCQSTDARVVTVTSIAHWTGQIPVQDPRWRTGLYEWGAQGQSRMTNVLFTHELDRRLQTRRSDVRAVACHLGYAPRLRGWRTPSITAAVRPLLHALVDPAVASGVEVRPAWWFGPPRVRPIRVDPELARRLWTWSEAETGLFGAVAA